MKKFGKRSGADLSEVDVKQLNKLQELIARIHNECGKSLSLKPTILPPLLDWPLAGSTEEEKGWILLRRTLILHEEAIKLLDSFHKKFGWWWVAFEDKDSGEPSRYRVKLFFGKTRQSWSLLRDDWMDCLIYALKGMSDFLKSGGNTKSGKV